MGQKMSELKGALGVDSRDGAPVGNVEDDNGNRLNASFEENGNNGDGILSSFAIVPSSSSMMSCTPSTSFERKKQSNGGGGGRHKEPRSGKKKRSHWVLSFNCARLKSNSATSSEVDFEESNVGLELCTDLWRPGGDHHLATGVVFQTRPSGSGGSDDAASGGSETALGPDEVAAIHEIIDLNQLNLRQDEFTLDDCDERARLERAREIAEGVEPPPGFRPGQHIKLLWVPDMNIDSLTALIQSAALSALSQLESQRVVHTQVDYIHCLVPDLLQIACCSFYWGKMDRYEAERLLEGKPEGTFLLRDSAQEEYLFSVSFRKYDRSLHARIEQWRHLFSFDSHDPGVFSSPTVCGLLEHYKDPSICMFFEPILTIPLHRNFAFPLQHLARAVICSKISYDGISQLKLPKALKSYLKEYHYKQRVKVTHFENE